jgi:hypothetical protein
VVVFFQCHCGCCSCEGGAGGAVPSWLSSSLLGQFAAVLSGRAGAGGGGEANGWCRSWDRCSVMPPAVGVCSSDFGATGASRADAGLAGVPGAVAEVTFVATGAGETVGGAFGARMADGAGCICGRAAAGCAVI